MRKKTKQRILMLRGVDRQWWGPGRRKIRKWRKRAMDRVDLIKVKLALTQLKVGMKTLDRLEFPLKGDTHTSDMAAFGKFHAHQAINYLTEAIHGEKGTAKGQEDAEEEGAEGR